MRRLICALVFPLLLAGTLCGQRAPMSRNQEPTADLQVRVVAENDQHINTELIRVDVDAFAGGTIASATCDHEGTARLSGLPPGGYTLHITGAGIRPTSVSINIEDNEGIHFEEVRVTPEATRGATSTAATVAAAELNVPGKARKECDKGNEAAKKKDWPGAIAHYREAVRLYPKYATAYNNLGVALLSSGDTAGARSAFESAVGSNDHYAQAYLNLGRLLYSQKEMQPAAELLSKLVSFDPVQPEALVVLASAELNLGKFDSAAAHALSVHRLQQPACVAAGTCPTGQAPADRYSVAHFVAGRALELSNKPSDAAAQFKLYLAEVPEGPLAPQARSELAVCEKAAPPASSAPQK